MKKIIISLVTITVILTVTTIYLMLQIDKTGPKIKIGEAGKEYASNMSESDLLSDVIAVDDKDGDVTDSLMIQDIIQIEKENAVMVIYSAMDYSHNLSTYRRKMSVRTNEITADETSNQNQEEVQDSSLFDESAKEEVEITYPVLSLTMDEVTKKVGENFYFGDYIEEVADDKDDVATLWRRIRVEGDYDMQRVGEYQLTYLVTDTDGNRSKTQTLTLKVVANN